MLYYEYYELLMRNMSDTEGNRKNHLERSKYAI